MESVASYLPNNISKVPLNQINAHALPREKERKRPREGREGYMAKARRKLRQMVIYCIEYRKKSFLPRTPSIFVIENLNVSSPYQHVVLLLAIFIVFAIINS